MKVTFEELTFLVKIYACNNDRSGSAQSDETLYYGMKGKFIKETLLFLDRKRIDDDRGNVTEIRVLRPTNKLLQELRVHDPIEVTAALIKAGEDTIISQAVLAREIANPGIPVTHINNCYACAVQWITYKLSLPQLVEFLSHEEETIRIAAQNRYQKLSQPKRIPFK